MVMPMENQNSWAWTRFQPIERFVSVALFKESETTTKIHTQPRTVHPA